MSTVVRGRRVVVGRAATKQQTAYRDKMKRQSHREIATLLIFALFFGSYLLGVRDAKYCEGTFSSQPAACQIVEKNK